MKEKISRLAKGIIEEDPPVPALKPDHFDAVIFPGKQQSFVIEAESLNGKSLKGVCYTDEARVEFTGRTFFGRRAHLVFTVDADGLAPGSVLNGTIFLVTNAGEFEIPFRFRAGSCAAQEKSYGRAAVPEPDRLPDPEDFSEDPENGFPVSAPAKEWESRSAGRNGEAFLETHLPEDPELISDLCASLIRREETAPLAFALYGRAIELGIRLSRLYESYLAAWPEERAEAMPRELLLYCSYEKEPAPGIADRLYANIIRYEPETSELYRQFEPRMRDFAMKNALDGRISRDLGVIYDRMFYPDMLDLRAAAVLPDLLRSRRITVFSPEAATVHVRCPGLRTIRSGRLKAGSVCLPVWFSDAVLTFQSADGRELGPVPYETAELMDRPDLLKRCFSLNPSHPMLLFSAARQVLAKGPETEEERTVLLTAFRELDLEDAFRNTLIRALCRAGGDLSWLSGTPLQTLDRETGICVFRVLMKAGREQEAYLWLRGAGAEAAETGDLSALATALLSRGEKPVCPDGTTDRFFTCLCRRVFDRGAATAEIMEFLTAEYEGSSEAMFGILEEAAENGLPTHDLAERTMAVLLFAGTENHLDRTFHYWLEKEKQEELLLRAFFAVRMTDYFEREDRTVPPEVFEALAAYLKIVRSPGMLPKILFLGLTAWYSARESLSPEETELCGKLVRELIAGGLVFRYTRELRKKIALPPAVTEKYYVEYRGGKDSLPRMTVQILPGGEASAPAPMKRVWKDIYVAQAVLFAGEELHYIIRDDALGPDPVEEGIIRAKSPLAGAGERFRLLERMTAALAGRNAEELKNGMLRYAEEREFCRGLFAAGGEEQ